MTSRTEQTCKCCGKSFVPKYKQTGRQKYCTRDCYFTWWKTVGREQRNKTTREYRARRYRAEGRWQDEGKKARELKVWMLELKSKPCTDCGQTFPVCCMQFDHRKGTKKKYNVGSMFAHHYSRELIEKELIKCDLVCSNCHAIRTQKRRLGSGGKHAIQKI